MADKTSDAKTQPQAIEEAKLDEVRGGFAGAPPDPVRAVTAAPPDPVRVAKFKAGDGSV